MSTKKIPEKTQRGQKRKALPTSASDEQLQSTKSSIINEVTAQKLQVRLNGRELLTDALTRKNSPSTSSSTAVDETQEDINAAVPHREYEVDPTLLAKQIEEALFLKHRSVLSVAYDEQLFTLVFNLKKLNNPGLRNALLRGEITPSEFVDMRSQDLANPELINARDADADWAKKIAMVKSLNPSKPTDAYTCHKCHKKECTTVQFQIRSADEGMTTFVSCMNCGHMWRD